MAEVDVRTARIITMYPIEGGGDTAVDLDPDAERRLFGVDRLPGRSEFAASPWRPALGDVREWDPAAYRAPNVAAAYEVTAVRTAVARLPGATVVLLDLELTGTPAAIISAER
ncbi:MAG: hypothetical protein ABW022_19840, partial [Actinoplanes sp.]